MFIMLNEIIIIFFYDFEQNSRLQNTYINDKLLLVLCNNDYDKIFCRCKKSQNTNLTSFYVNIVCRSSLYVRH